MKKFVVLGIATLFAGQAMANDGLYVGGQYSKNTLKVKEDGISLSTDVGILNLIGGYQFNQNFALEARLGTGVKDKKWREGSYTEKLSAGLSSGLYAKGIVPLSQEFSVYGVAGYARTEYKDTETGPNYKDTDKYSSNGFSYGIGGEFAFTPQLSATLEFLSLPTKTFREDGWEFKIRSSNVSVGINYRF